MYQSEILAVNPRTVSKFFTPYKILSAPGADSTCLAVVQSAPGADNMGLTREESVVSLDLRCLFAKCHWKSVSIIISIVGVWTAVRYLQTGGTISDF